MRNMEEGNYRVDRFTLNPISSGDFGKGDQLGRQKNATILLGGRE